MDRDRGKKIVWYYPHYWWLLILGLILGAGAGWSFYVESNRNYGQLATSLITVAGVVLTLAMTQARATKQQEKEDERHHTRLTAEAERQDERLRVESEREHERLKEEARKDRAQRSITQRLDLAKNLATAVEHLSSEKNELKQAAGVQEILFQIDDWNALIKTETAEVKEEGEGVESGKEVLKKESLRHRQELFDIAYKFDTENVELLKFRARGLKQRLTGGDDHSLAGLDFSEMVVGISNSGKNNAFQIDLARVSAKGFVMSNSDMRNVNLSFAHLERAILEEVHLEGANLSYAHLERALLPWAHLEGANLKEACLEGALLSWARLEGALLERVRLEGAILEEVRLEGANLNKACLARADFSYAHLEGTDLLGACLEGANLLGAHLEGTDLLGACLEGANLLGAHLEGANLNGACLKGANLESVYFDWNALRNEKLLDKSRYDGKTVFPKGFNPEEYGMILVDKEDAS